MPDIRAWWAELRRRKPVLTWWEDIRRRRPIADFLGAVADRDRDAQGSVLGSAVAMRLFLFLIPAAVTIVSFIALLGIGSWLEGTLDNGLTTGDVVHAVEDESRWGALWLTISGLALTAWAGRSLANVLGACSAAAWRLPPAAAKVGLVSALSLSAVVFIEVLASGLVAGLRDLGGAPAWALSWGALAGIIGFAWFLVLLTLPRGVTDPGALLPGAVAVGVVQATVQGILREYAEGRVARTTDTYGNLAVTIAILGNLFILGRIMTASFVFSAVTYERFGSLSEAIFALPLVRRLPRRYPWLAEFFSLEVGGGDSVRATESSPDARSDDAAG